MAGGLSEGEVRVAGIRSLKRYCFTVEGWRMVVPSVGWVPWLIRARRKVA